ADEFGFAFGEIEREAIGLGEGADEKDEEGDGDGNPENGFLEVESVSPGKKEPAVVDLVLNNLGEVEAADDEKDGDDGEAHGDFVGDHLGAGADAAEEGIF